jgi:Holliday junction resolvase
MKESDIQSKVIKFVEAKGGYVVKIVSSSKAGKADLIVCYLGLFIAIEMKKPGEDPEPLQIYNQKKVRKSGGISIIGRSVGDVKLLLDSLGKHTDSTF